MKRLRAGMLVGMTGLALAGREVLRSRHVMDLSGRVVLITGGSRGLGFVMARECAREGARVAICARNADGLEAAREDVAALGAEVLALPCDVRDREQVRGMVREVLTRFGQIDVLINNAGIISVAPLEAQTIDDFRRSMDTMYWGVVYPTLEVLPGMRARHDGRIVNITSIGGKVSVPHMLSCSGAKFAAVGFSEGPRAELAGSGVYVTTVVPWLMRTGSHVNALFRGRHRAEYTWFSLGAALPLVVQDAESAARRIVQAAKLGESEVAIGLPAALATRFHGLFPGLTSDLLAVADRLLPSARDAAVDAAAHRGGESETAVTRSFITALGRDAAHEYHQYPLDDAVIEHSSW